MKVIYKMYCKRKTAFKYILSKRKIDITKLASVSALEILNQLLVFILLNKVTNLNDIQHEMRRRFSYLEVRWGDGAEEEKISTFTTRRDCRTESNSAKYKARGCCNDCKRSWKIVWRSPPCKESWWLIWK